MERKSLLTRKKSSKRRATAPETVVFTAMVPLMVPIAKPKKSNNVTLEQASPAENKPRCKHPRKRNLKAQKGGETDKENSMEFLNNMNLNNTFEIEISKGTPRPSLSSFDFNQTNESNKKTSTDSDVEFSEKMKQRRPANIETKKTQAELNSRKSVHFMSTNTPICPPYIPADVMENMTPEDLEEIKAIVERYDESRKCAKRKKSTPYVKSKNSVILSKGSATRSTACDRPRRISRTPQKYACIDLVTPEAEPSLKRESTFLVDSPSVVFMDNTKSKIQESFNDYSTTKQQRKKWDKSLGADMSNNSGFNRLDDKNSPTKKNTPKRQRKKWNKSLGVTTRNSSFFNIQETEPPITLDDLFPPPANDEFSIKNTTFLPEHLKVYSSTPKCPSVRTITHEEPYPEEPLLKEPITVKSVPVKSKMQSKIPNFALIHEKNFRKMENIKELVERKAKRAELLLSGQKPPRKVDSPKNSNVRKHLNYSPKKMPAAGVTASSASKANVRPPTKTNNKPIELKTASKPVMKKFEAAKAVTKIAKPTKRRSIENQKNGFTKFGFKVGQEGVKKVSKDEQAKAVATKTKIGATTVDKRRILTQNVRSNRRFDLLMQMRNKNK